MEDENDEIRDSMPEPPMATTTSTSMQPPVPGMSLGLGGKRRARGGLRGGGPNARANIPASVISSPTPMEPGMLGGGAGLTASGGGMAAEPGMIEPGMVRSAEPGAIATTAATSQPSSSAALSQEEQDAMMKQRIKNARRAPATPGAITGSLNDTPSVQEPGALSYTPSVQEPGALSYTPSVQEPGALSSTGTSMEPPPPAGTARVTTQAEQDEMAKGRARSSRMVQGAPTTPGVSMVREPGAVQSTPPPGSMAMEPGAAVTTKTVADAMVSQMEQDALAKARARSSVPAAPGAMSSPPVAVREPGAPTSGGASAGMSQAEQDALAKGRGRSARTVQATPGAMSSFPSPATEPGAPAAMSAEVNRAVSQAEQDAMAKARGRSARTVQITPGAMPSMVDEPKSAAVSAFVSQAEQDAIAKGRGRSARTVQATPGAASSFPSPATEPGAPAAMSAEVSRAISQAEQDAFAKARARSSRNTAPAAPGALTSSFDNAGITQSSSGHQMMALQEPGQMVTSSVRQMETELMNKASGVEPAGSASGLMSTIPYTTPANSSFPASSGNAAVAPAATSASMFHHQEPMQHEEYSDEQINFRDQGVEMGFRDQGVEMGFHDQGIAPDIQMASEQTRGASMNASFDVAPTVPATSSAAVNEAAVTVGETPPAPVIYGEDGEQVEVDGAGAVEAFVADTVIDATNVAVVMSEEEEEKVEQQKYKKYLLGCGVMFCCCAIVIIVPVVIFVALREPEQIIVEVMPSAQPSAVPSEAPSFAPTTDPFHRLVDVVEPLSTPGVFNDRSSPQYRAALWLSEDEFIEEQGYNFSHTKVLQRYALASFYYSVHVNENSRTTEDRTFTLCHQSDTNCVGDPAESGNGEPGTFPWLSPVDECWWAYIQCTDESSDDFSIVDIMNFPARGNNLGGTLPDELRLLTDLRVFNLPTNNIGGNLDGAFVNVTTLESFIVIGNDFSGTFPEYLYLNNSLLGTIFMGDNSFSGTIPSQLSKLPLRRLQIEANAFTGPIPSELGNATSIVFLNLHTNQLTGAVPHSLYNLTQLRTLNLHTNANLTGELDPLIGELTSIQDLRLGGTQMGGTLPSELYGLSTLRELSLESANFNGTLSEDFRLMNYSLQEVILNDNDFTGTIPEGFDHLTFLSVLHLQGNRLNGTVSEALCDRRGTTAVHLNELWVGCDVECRPACCEDICP